MMNLLKTAIVLAVAVTGCLALIPSTPTVETGSTEATSTAALYRRHCASCHGVDGKSNTAKGVETDADDLTTAKVQGMSTARIAAVIRTGKGDMPGFARKMTAAQINSVAQHVKRF
jgi:mono/diheme cytochrome c family protein